MLMFENVWQAQQGGPGAIAASARRCQSRRSECFLCKMECVLYIAILFCLQIECVLWLEFAF
jgi:hypothetical protein